MKSSKLNTKIPVATKIFFEASSYYLGWKRALNLVIVENSENIFALGQKMDVHPSLIRGKSVSVVTFWRHELSRNLTFYRSRKFG
jgi:hypothetical protein